MCVLCAQVGRAAGGFGCADVSALTADAKGDATTVDLQRGAAFAPTIGTDDPVSQNPGPGGDTVPGATSTAFSATNDSYVRGYINTSGDQDWYSVTLTAGQQYTFFMNGFGVGAIRDPFLRLYGSNGAQILKTNGTTISDSTNNLVEDDDSGPLNGSLLKYTPAASGTYYISAGGWVPPIGAGSTGQYLLTMNDGGTPYSPTVSLTDVADYLSNSYWEVNGVAPAKWNITNITYRATGLETERAVLARIAFQTWADVTGLTFTEITSGTAKITLDDTTANAAFENSSTSGGVINSATINVSTDWYGGSDAIDSYTLQTFIHEIGHALGLGHGGPYNGSASAGVDNVYANDSWHLAVMSYFDQAEMNIGSFRFIMTPEMADILAAQRYYGAPNTRPGDTIYGFNSNAAFTNLAGSPNLYNFAAYSQAPAFTIYDGSGSDSLDASGYGNNQLLDLGGGNFSNTGGLTGNIGIYTSTVIETGIGGSGNDTIIGNSAANTLIGNGGNDTISGGDGNDRAVFSGLSSAYTLTDLGGGSVRVAGPDGADTLSGIESLIFSDQTVLWSGSGPAHVLFSNQGAVFASDYHWEVNNRSLVSEGAIALYDKAFTVQVIGDYDGDGKTDVLFQNPTTGGVWQWRLDGGTILSQGAVDVGDPAFKLLGTGDFNGDGKDDVLFRNDAGFVFEWQMNGRQNTPLAVGALDPVWHVQGTGDFNGDGRDDILLRNSSDVANENGAFFLWQMKGNAIENQAHIERPPVAWKTLGIGDFDGDGKDDFAVRNVSATSDNGAVWVYLMNGTAIKTQGAAGIADAATWKLQQIGDLDGDGRDDLLFRDDAGFFYSWNMNGTAIASEGPLQGAAQWADPSFAVVQPYWDLV